MFNILDSAESVGLDIKEVDQVLYSWQDLIPGYDNLNLIKIRS